MSTSVAHLRSRGLVSGRHLRRRLDGAAFRPHPRAAGRGPRLDDGTFISEDIEAAVARAREAAGGKDVGLFGADLARQSLERGLLDEIIVDLAPVLLGDGVRLFAVPGGRRVR